MARYFGYDIQTDIKAKLVADLNTEIGTINTTRTTTTPTVLSYTSFWDQKQYPVCLIDIISSDTILDDGELNTEILRTIEDYTLEVTIANKSARDKDSFALDFEVYEEALKKTLHGFSNTGIVWTLATSTIRNEVNTQQNQTMKFITVQFLIRVQTG